MIYLLILSKSIACCLSSLVFSFFQWVCSAAALRDGCPCAALALHCFLSDALDARLPESHQPHGQVSCFAFMQACASHMPYSLSIL